MSETLKPNGWNEHQRLVLSELERNNENFEKLDAKVDALIAKVAVLETRQTIMSIFLPALGSGITLLATYAVQLFLHK